MTNPICRGTARPPPKTSLAQNNQTGALNQRQAIQRNCENYQQYDSRECPIIHPKGCNCPMCKPIPPPKTSLALNNQTGTWNQSQHGPNCKCPICGGGKKPPKTSQAQASENYQQYDNMTAHGPNCKCPICGRGKKPPKTSQAQASENYQQYDNMTAHGPNCKCPICGGGKKPPKTSYGPSSTADGGIPRFNCEALADQNCCEQGQEIDQLYGPPRERDNRGRGFWVNVGRDFSKGFGQGIGSAIGDRIGSIWGANIHGENNECELEQENCQEFCPEVVECPPGCATNKQ